MSKENLDNLLASFYDADQVDGVKEDIRIGDEIIASGETLVPDAAVISGIKNDISARLKSRRDRRMNTISMRTAVAAMIAIVAFIGIRTMIHQGDSPIRTDIASGFFWGEDAVASSIANELNEINYTILSSSLDDDETESVDAVDALEYEIMVADASFWR
ncbi:MAG: hypothetical protein FVQ82_09015 [Planctomycetes bacterium]|nr:hypothetical protein [Planctomycetota bacterium]